MISVIVPCRETDTPYTALRSIAESIIPFQPIIVYDQGNGANWARNRGAEMALGDYLLFSDCDVEWLPHSLVALYATLSANPQASYAYGAYQMGGKTYCDQPFDADRLRQNNYISTMSLVRRKDFSGFDESIERLQDWDLWLTMLEQGKHGVYCGHTIFRTKHREGITFGSGIGWDEARAIVARKHGIA